jgi:membrane protein insertase Oxa1/YidC/SpoIIIJ
MVKERLSVLSQESQDQASSEEQQAAQQERQEQQEQQPQVEEHDEQSPTPKPRKRHVMRKLSQAELEAISPRPSYWPLALALAVVVFLYGAVGNPIIMGIGAVLVLVAVIGWGLERR